MVSQRLNIERQFELMLVAPTPVRSAAQKPFTGTKQATPQTQVRPEPPTPSGEKHQVTSYPNVFDDPDSPPQNASTEEVQKQTELLRIYGREMLEAYEKTELKGESL